MVRIFTIAFILFSIQLVAQVRTVSGRLKASDGSPLPGVNVVVKGTTIGTTTDINGFYSIEAPVGSTLVFSFIGMATREMVVTPNWPESVRTRQRSSDDEPTKKITVTSRDTTVHKRGIAILSDQSPQYFTDGVLDPQAILSVRRIGRLRAFFGGIGHGSYRVIQSTTRVNNKFGLQFTTAFSLESITQKPALQNDYAQGESSGGQLRWMGPETGELFSWGPLMRTLEYDGSAYPFDNKGMLVPSGLGTGKAAIPYDASGIFRTGVSTENDLILYIPTTGQFKLMINGGLKHRSGVLPGSFSTRRNVEISLKKFRVNESISGDANVFFQHANGNLMNRGANLASITAVAWRTPVSFDNSNGLSPKSAYNNPESYRLTDGSMRSHAPGLTDNSYGLVNELPDNEVSKRLLSTMLLRFDRKSPFNFTLTGSIDKQWNNVIFGIPPGLSGFPNGRITRRDEEQLYLNAIIGPSYRKAENGNELNLRASYQINYSDRLLNRVDGLKFAEGMWDEPESANIVQYLRKNLSRSTHEISLNGTYQFQSWLTIRAANQSYFSSTLEPSVNNVFLPTAGVNIRLENLLDIYWMDMLTVYGSYLKTMREAPLLYNNWSYLSTISTPADYNTYFESTELFFNHGVRPETENKFETGLSATLLSRLSLDLSVYYNTTHDFIIPIQSEGRFNLTNAATVVNNGASVVLKYNSSYWQQNFNWNVSLGWSKYNSQVNNLYSGEQFHRLAGFENIAKVMAEGQPVGALFGTTYKRDNQGRMVIGSDGFPLVDESLKKIGNPIPDWTSFVETNLTWRKLKLSGILEFRKGGQVWNGTRAALDYLGRSVATAEGRTVSNYVFEGTLENGMPNTQPVTFYDPSTPVENNRWVRYGFAGVGEEYVEDASWIRLNELSLSYTLHPRNVKLHYLRIAVVGRNLFLTTPYSGVDPSTALFGYSASGGLDLFNAPATRSYTLQLTIKI